MPWNGFPATIQKTLINKLKRKYLSNTNSSHEPTDDGLPKIWLCQPHLGKKGEFLVKS